MQGGPSLQSRDRGLQSCDARQSASCCWRWVVATFTIKRPEKLWTQVSENKDITSYSGTGTPDFYPQKSFFLAFHWSSIDLQCCVSFRCEAK